MLRSPIYNSLCSYFLPYVSEGIAIAYSGGVDSTLLLKTAVDARENYIAERKKDAASIHSLPILAVILETKLHPHSDTETALSLARSLGAEAKVITVDEFQDPTIKHNPMNRCYLCKKLLFSSLTDLARSMGYSRIFDGTNKDDEKQYRPGMLALTELGILSPLQKLGITKNMVREVSAELGLSTAFVPSTPCLATRLPYGALLDAELLARIYKGEQFLRKQGYYNVRLRFHDPILRIELDVDAFSEAIKNRELIISRLKELGFSYITLDLEGFRSGSMDIHITEKRE